jgi:hypothetical protein
MSPPCPALVCTCGSAPFTPTTRAGRSPRTLLALVGQDAISRGVARPLASSPGPAPRPGRVRRALTRGVSGLRALPGRIGRALCPDDLCDVL